MLAKFTRQALLRQAAPRTVVRCLTAVPQTRSTNEDLVKTAIQKMMLQQQEKETAGVTAEALQKASYSLQVRCEESG